MSTTTGGFLAFPISKSKAPTDNSGAPVPNENRSRKYPNKWTVEPDNQTAKCGICRTSLKGTKWHIKCAKCHKIFCQPCWNGDRKRGGEQVFEGPIQNQEGCWCGFGGLNDPAHKDRFLARAKRIAERNGRPAGIRSDTKVEALPQEQHEKVAPAGDNDDIDGPPAKGVKFEKKDRKINQDQETTPNLKPEPKLEDEDCELELDDQSLPQLKPNPKLEKKTTVIVGAGVIGLSIARALAVDARATGTSHKIIVADINDSYARNASRDCAGLITNHGMQPELASLWNLSVGEWRDILSAPDVANKVHHQTRGVVHVKDRSNKHDGTCVPSWCKSRKPIESFKTSGSDVGKISPQLFSDWLFDQCKAHGVEFCFHHEITYWEKTMDASLTLVELSSTKPNEQIKPIKCQNLVIAAGPWTTSIFNSMVSWNRLELDNNVQKYSWIRIPRNILDEHDDVGLISSIGGNNESVMAAQPEANRILTAVMYQDGNSKIHRMNAFTPNKIENVSGLKMIARERLLKEVPEAGLQKGVSFISTGMDGLPHIDKVHPLTLDDRAAGSLPGFNLGMYLCYGFGKHGTALAPGAARALCRRISGEKSGIDDQEFSLPGLPTPPN